MGPNVIIPPITLPKSLKKKMKNCYLFFVINYSVIEVISLSLSP